ncbi:IS91 family transposase [Ferrovum myxofaciens]|uniref:IS91 family transposase n=1 Tax=Ferrovum myxofaciens TaxID=416213 RepID=UPI003EB87406
MIRLAEIVAQYAPELIKQYGHELLQGQLKALSAFELCRSANAPKMLLACDGCDKSSWLPHSCGNRHCPHCQSHESQRWIDKQLQKLVPGEYFMVTFTLPAEFRQLAWHHQRELYELIIRNAWATVNTFSQNDKKLRGTTGAVTVLHTHNRRLDFHPHVHLVMPAVAFDARQRLWRNKRSGFLFDHKALAKVFRAKMLESIRQAGLQLPRSYPAEWVVDCKAVGTGQKALVYLGRYLYRGVLPEKNIVSDQNGKVTFRYQNSKTKQWESRTLSGVEFLHKILLHILPKGFRRARNFGFLHPNSRLVKLVQLIKRVFVPPPKPRPVPGCPCCGKPMRIVRTRVKYAGDALPSLASIRETAM